MHEILDNAGRFYTAAQLQKVEKSVSVRWVSSCMTSFSSVK